MKLKLKTQSGSNQEHALLSPSSAKKWLACPAALACEFGIPNESGQAAINGTSMHTLSEVQINAIIKGLEIPMSRNLGAYVLNEGKGPIKALTKVVRGAIKITDDFIDQASKYVDYCRPIIDAAELVEVEYRVNLGRILHPGVMVVVRDKHGEILLGEDGKPQMAQLYTFGTADLVALLPVGDGTFMLVVIDLKTGRHKVLAKENKQMMLYALGILKALSRQYEISAVRLVIFQPYSGGADEWDITPEALEQFGKFASTRALRAIDAFERGKKGLKPADFRPGNDACEWCRFSEKCNAKRKAVTTGALISTKDATDVDLGDGVNIADDAMVDAHALNMIHKFVTDADYQDVWDHVTPADILKLIPDANHRKNVEPKAEAGEMTPSQIKAEWDRLPLMRKHIADIEKAMYTLLMSGEKVDGLKLVEGSAGNRSWALAEEDIVDIMEMGGVPADVMYTSKVLNPTAAEKAIAKSYPRVWRKLSKQVTRKPGAPSIAPADDKRAEYQAAKDEDLAD